jgi:hypothetical protein
MNDLFPGIDGMVPKGTVTANDCCSPTPCEVDPCQVARSFIGLLPSGPLWDAAKYKAMTVLATACDCAACWTPDHCPSMVDYAIHMGQRLAGLINGPLWVSVRERDPFTAYSSTSEWLDRLGWADCFNTLCRSHKLGDLTPIEIMTECGATLVQIEYGQDYLRAYESAVIKSLSRLNYGIIKNLASINFVLEPLKARVVPAEFEDACESDEVCLTIEKTSDTFDGVTPKACGIPLSIPAYIDRDAMGLPADLPRWIWPGHMAAECITRSLLSHNPRFCFIRSQETPG